MPSVSKQQQKFFGLVRALQKGDVSPSSVTKKARDAAKDMKKSDVKKYAATKHKGLPRKVRGELKVRELIKKMVREILDEQKMKQLAVIRSSQPQSPYTIFQDGNGFVMKGGRGFSLSFKDENTISKNTESLKDYLNRVLGYWSYQKGKIKGINEGKLTEAFDLKKLEDAIKMFQKKIKKQGRVTNARDEEHLEKLIKVYKEMGGKKIKEGKLTENRKQIAQTILQQLGGNKFIAMTGAKNLGFDSKGSKTTLSFKIGKNSRNINYVKVDYISGKDLYDMSFFRLRAGQLKLIKKVSSIYGDQLQKFFTKNTGLYTRL